MPAKLFDGLNAEKKKAILSAALTEFAACGYKNASTNVIVKNSGISKGSLFKYFKNKEDLYFYLLDAAAAELTLYLEEKTAALSRDFFQRVLEYSSLELSWYIQNPEKGKLIISAFTKSDTELYQKTVKRYGAVELDLFYKTAQGIDPGLFCCDKEKAVNIIKWFLKGFNEDFLERIQNDKGSFEDVHSQYMRSISEYTELLKTGLLK